MAKRKKEVVEEPVIESLAQVMAPTYTLEVTQEIKVEEEPSDVNVIASLLGFRTIFCEKTFGPRVHAILRMSNGVTRVTDSSYALEDLHDAYAFGCKVDSLIAVRHNNANSYEMKESSDFANDLKAMDAKTDRDYAQYHAELAKEGLHIRHDFKISSILGSLHDGSYIAVLVENRK